MTTHYWRKMLGMWHEGSDEAMWKLDDALDIPVVSSQWIWCIWSGMAPSYRGFMRMERGCAGT